MKNRYVTICDVLAGVSLAFTISSIGDSLRLCSILGGENSDIFIWQAVEQGVNLYVMMFLCLLSFLLSRNVRKGIVFEKQNARLLKLAGVAVLSAGIVYYVICFISPVTIGMAGIQFLYVVLGLFILFVGYLFDVGIRMREDQELTI